MLLLLLLLLLLIIHHADQLTNYCMVITFMIIIFITFMIIIITFMIIIIIITISNLLPGQHGGLLCQSVDLLRRGLLLGLRVVSPVSVLHQGLSGTLVRRRRRRCRRSLSLSRVGCHRTTTSPQPCDLLSRGRPTSVKSSIIANTKSTHRCLLSQETLVKFFVTLDDLVTSDVIPRDWFIARMSMNRLFKTMNE